MKTFFTFFFILTSYVIFGQTGKVRGIAIDEVMGEPILSATVLIKGTTQGTLTDLEQTPESAL